MDWETEKRLAALIVEEATRLREQADKEGVHAYLAKPALRRRPNPQFLKATVRGLEQANRVAEVNDMWRRRTVELRHETRDKKRRHKDKHNHAHDVKMLNEKGRFTQLANSSCSEDGDISRRLLATNVSECMLKDTLHYPSGDPLDDGLNEEEVEEFLHSRVKRGRGMVGSRMDETGPYLLPGTGQQPDIRVKEDWEDRVIGPTLGPSLRLRRSVQESPSRKHRKKKHKVKDIEVSCDDQPCSDSRKQMKKHSYHRSSKKKKQKREKN